MNTQTENRHNQNNQKTETGPKEGQEVFQTKAKDQPMAEIMSRRQDRGPHKDDKKRKTYRRNRHKLNHNLCMTYPFLSVCNEISCIECKNKCDMNQELVILSKQMLIQAQKDVLKKGLSFIPKLKKSTFTNFIMT